MQHNTDTLYNTIIGGGISALAYLIGGIDQLATALGIFMISDYLTGWMVAIYRKNFNSAVGFRGIMKKTAMIFAVIMAVQLDLISGGGQFMRNMMIMFLIGMEGISIIENLGHLGVNVPRQISAVFAQLKEDPAAKIQPQAKNKQSDIEDGGVK
ncbi:holin [Domibacillus aminovorans]|uniref:Holin n=1 Tax=Domibacillus aminovorans TaxID=29332 RepID=A0A177KKF5_9BACI|nr:phage holin family protein [Domibacillus aminovorans]OAH53061.1 holin [Domibacillus aminovorans]